MKTIKKYLKKLFDRAYDNNNYLRGNILNLLLLVSIVIMGADIYGSIDGDFERMLWIESFLIVVFIFLYLFHPERISFVGAGNIFIGLIMFLIVISLTLPGYNQGFALFALAAMPASIFFLLGLKTGVRWSIIISLFIFISMLNASMHWIPPVFSTDLLLEVNVAYIVISYFYYRLEKERVDYEQQLSKMIQEKNILLKEIHHRAKNNLQTIMGLLESQALRVENKGCKQLLRAQRNRLQSMSLLHQHLAYETGYEKVNMSQYLIQIVHNLQKTTDHILDVKIDDFQLSMSEGINLGLLLNEAVSNAIKHAYPKESMEKIEVTLRHEGNHLQLRVKDFGQGFDATVEHKSLGIVLMKDIIRFFPEGRLMFNTDNGTEVIVDFDLKIEEASCQKNPKIF